MIRISRQKCYPGKAHPGPAWTWLYTVNVLDSKGKPIGGPYHRMIGKGIGWAMDAAHRAIREGHGTGPVIRDWKSAPAGVNETVSGSRQGLICENIKISDELLGRKGAK